MSLNAVSGCWQARPSGDQDNSRVVKPSATCAIMKKTFHRVQVVTSYTKKDHNDWDTTQVWHYQTTANESRRNAQNSQTTATAAAAVMTTTTTTNSNNRQNNRLPRAAFREQKKQHKHTHTHTATDRHRHAPGEKCTWQTGVNAIMS